MISEFNKTGKIGFHVSPNMQVGPVAGESTIFGTFKAAVVFNHKFVIGGMASFSISEINPQLTNQPENTYFDIRMGWLVMEYVLSSSKLVHFTFPLTIWGGEVELGRDDESSSSPFGENNFLFIEPGAMLEINVHENVRLNTGLTYRIVASDVDYQGLNNTDLSGLTANVGLKFGIF